MAIVLVDSIAPVSASHIDLDWAVTSGNTLICWLGFDPNTQSASAIVDTQGNTWVKAIRNQASRAVEIWYSLSAAAGDINDEVRPTLSEGSNAWISVAEFSGVVSSDDTGTDEQASGTSHPCGEVTTTVAESLIVTGTRTDGAYVGTPIDFTELYEAARLYLQYKILAATGTHDGEWTSDASEAVTSAIAAFHGAGAPAGGKPRYYYQMIGRQ